jgi:hypothetical protein
MISGYLITGIIHLRPSHVRDRVDFPDSVIYLNNHPSGL